MSQQLFKNTIQPPPIVCNYQRIRTPVDHGQRGEKEKTIGKIDKDKDISKEERQVKTRSKLSW